MLMKAFCATSRIANKPERDTDQNDGSEHIKLEMKVSVKILSIFSTQLGKRMMQSENVKSIRGNR